MARASRARGSSLTLANPNHIMGLISNILGNASEIDIASMRAELSPVLVPGETIERGFKVFRDMFVFTDRRLVMIDKQGLTGSKVCYHSVLYRSITQFSVETAGSFDADSEMKIWVSGAAMPITKEFKKGTDVIGIQKLLAFQIFSLGSAPSSQSDSGGRVPRIPDPEVDDHPKYFVEFGSSERGPFTLAQLSELLATNRIEGTASVRIDGEDGKKQLASLVSKKG